MEKIIFGITSLTFGGAERVLVDIVNNLIDKFEITIFTIYSKGDLEKELDTRVKIVSLYNEKYTELSKKNKILNPLNVLINKNKIYKKYIDSDDYKAQIAFLEGPITRIFSSKQKNKKSNKIAWIHNDISKVFGKNLKSKIKRFLDRYVYEKYDKLVFVSIDNLDKFNRVYDDIELPHEKVINNYIDTERILKLSEEKPDILFDKDEVNLLQVSRLVEQKGIDRMIEAHTNLIKQEIKQHIYVIGDGPLRESLQEEINKNNVQDSFTLLGKKANPYPYMKQADAICLFSRYEGYGMVIDEAKCLNKYIISTNTASREALIDYAGNNWIVENSEEGVEQGIRYVVSNRKRILDKNIQYVCTNKKIIDKIVKMINE